MDADPKSALATAEETWRKHRLFCLPCALPEEAAGVGDRCAAGGRALQADVFRLREVVAQGDRDARNDFADWGAERVRDGVL